MQVLCSALPMEGHVRPLLPIAHALAGAGHDVRFATGPDFQDQVRNAKLIPLLAGPTFDDAFSASERDPRFAQLSLTQRGGATFSQIIAPSKLLDLERIVGEWRPDLIVHECTDLAAPIVAALIGVPAVSQGWGLVPVPGQTVPNPTDVVALWRSRRLESDAYCGIFGKIHLHPMPPSLEPDAHVPVGRLQPMRLETATDADARLPEWIACLAATGRPLVYVSLGTHAYFSRPEFFQTILEGLATLDVEVIATIGQHNDPAAVGPQPRNIHIERWLPVAPLLQRCRLVVCHGGSGTLLATLAAGLPTLLLPRGADQYENAAACARVGAARVVPSEALTAAAVATEVDRLLTDRSYTEAAAGLRAEIEAMPKPAEVVPRIEELVSAGIRRDPQRRAAAPTQSASNRDH